MRGPRPWVLRRTIPSRPVRRRRLARVPVRIPGRCRARFRRRAGRIRCPRHRRSPSPIPSRRPHRVPSRTLSRGPFPGPYRHRNPSPEGGTTPEVTMSAEKGLAEYRRRRDFAKTVEPKGSGSGAGTGREPDEQRRTAATPSPASAPPKAAGAKRGCWSSAPTKAPPRRARRTPGEPGRRAPDAPLGRWPRQAAGSRDQERPPATPVRRCAEDADGQGRADGHLLAQARAGGQ